MSEATMEERPGRWPRDEYGEFAFGDEMLPVAMLSSPFLVIAIGGVASALPLPDDLRLPVAFAVGFGTFVLCTAGFLVVPFLLGHRYHNEDVGEAAKMLASLGLLRGRAGRRRRRALHQLDKEARRVEVVMGEVQEGKAQLLGTGAVEPLLISELDARTSELELRLQAIVSEAHAFARQERLNTLGTDEQIASAKETAESRAALTQAMQALEQSREVIYQDPQTRLIRTLKP